MDERTDWWQRLGGPNAINLPAWIFTLVGGTLASFSWMPDGPLIRAAEWMVLSLAAQLALGGVLIMARVTYLQREPRPSRPAALIGTLLVAGFLRGALLAFAGEELSLTEHGFVLERATGQRWPSPSGTPSPCLLSTAGDHITRSSAGFDPSCLESSR